MFCKCILFFPFFGCQMSLSLINWSGNFCIQFNLELPKKERQIVKVYVWEWEWEEEKNGKMTEAPFKLSPLKHAVHK